jgi:amino acid adenylation domain-containing protein
MSAIDEDPSLHPLSHRTSDAKESDMTTDVTQDEYLVADASHAQQRFWLMEQLETDGSVYNIRVGLRLCGTLNIDALHEALREVVRRHEVLRTNLVFEDGTLLQYIVPVADLPMPVEDLSHAADPELQWQHLAETELQQPFDIATELPIRATLLRLSPTEHLLLLNLSHAVCDAWSMRVLHSELIQLYGAFAAGEPSPLPDLPVQYADFAEWQKQWLAEGESDRQLAYWRSVLADAPPSPLPGNGPRPEQGTNRTASHTLPAALITELERLAKQERVSLYSSMLAAFAVLLARHARQDDLVIGALLAGRSRAEIEDLIGFFVNTVALRIDTGREPSFRELMHHIHDVVLDAEANQDVPFERVADEFAKVSDQPLFNVMFQMVDLTRETVTVDGLDLSPIPMMSQPAPMDLVVAVLPQNGVHTCEWDFRDDLLDPAMVSHLQRQYTTLLASVVRNPDERITRLAMTPDEERAFVLSRSQPATSDADWCLTCQVQDHAQRTPDAPAIVTDEETVSFAGLENRATRLARLLRQRGAGPDVLVGIHVARGVDQLVALLAVLKAGAAYLPLDPAYPAQRLAHMVEDAAPRLVIASDAAGAALGIDESRTIDVGAAESPIESHSDDPLPCAAHPDHLAYVIYTSGSTGRPKGTAITRRGLAVIADAQREQFVLGATDRILQFAPMSFDASMFEVLMAWPNGAALFVPPLDAGIAVDLHSFLAQHRVTAVVLPPTALTALVEDRPLPHLRVVTVAGERCPPALARRWAEDREFFNLYGPTEATIWSTFHRVADVAGSDVTGATVPIGRPVPGVACHVLDSEGNLAAVGVPGELRVGGPVLARGYLGRAAMTADRFVPDPFGTGTRLYRTGDLVRWNHEGDLEFLGRIDDQVKVRGFRIEPAEIEACLAGHPDVREATVVVRDESVDAHLVAFVTGDVTDTGNLRDWCSVRLPEYMVPAAVVVLDHLPLGPTGKIDRAALQNRPREEAVSDSRPPEDPLEQAIAEVWSDVLGDERVVPRDGHFFALGGNSLAATRVVIRLRNDFQLEVPIRTLFDRPTLTGFTSAIRELAAETT